MHEKSYFIIKAVYSKRLDRVLTHAKEVSMTEVLDYIQKAKTAKSIIYGLRFPNDTETVLSGESERNARTACRMLAQQYDSKVCDMMLVDITEIYEQVAQRARKRVVTDSAFSLALGMQEVYIWAD